MVNPAVVVWFISVPFSSGFIIPTNTFRVSPIRVFHNALHQREGPILDDIPSQFEPLFAAAVNATILKGARVQMVLMIVSDTSGEPGVSMRILNTSWIE
jgi:hypothetical protein